jgi:hypothetical protein
MAHLLQAVHAMLILAVLGIGYWQRWQYWVGLVRVVKGMVQVKMRIRSSRHSMPLLLL